MKRFLFLLAMLATTATAQQQLTNIVVWSTNANGVALRVTNSVALNTNLFEVGSMFAVGNPVWPGPAARIGTSDVGSGDYRPFLYFGAGTPALGEAPYGSDTALMIGGNIDANHEWVIIRVRDDPHYIFHSDEAEFRSPLIMAPYGGGNPELLSIYNESFDNNAKVVFNIDGATDPYNATLMFTGSATVSNGVYASKLVANCTTNAQFQADNQTVNCTNKSYIVITSNSGTSTSRTFVLTPGVKGQELTLEFQGQSSAAELQDDSANTGGGNNRLVTLWSPAQYDTLRLIFNGTDWIELSRSTN